MLSVPAGVRIWLVAGLTDMRRGIDGLSALVQTQLSAEVLSGQLFIFRGVPAFLLSFFPLGFGVFSRGLSRFS